MIVIFDLDGTLLDTYQLIRQNFVEVFKGFLPEHSYDEEELKSFFGPPLIDSFMRVVNNKEIAEKLIKEYRVISDGNYSKYLRLFPNVEEVLKALKAKDHKLAIFSNRLNKSIIRGLELTNIKDYFDYIVGIDDVVNPKPDPEGIEKIKSYFKTDNCVFIGDAPTDIEAAKRANIKSVGCTWALTKKETFQAAKADFIAEEYNDLIKIMEELSCLMS